MLFDGCRVGARILRSQLEQRLGSRIDGKYPLMSWIPRHAANCVSRCKLMDDGRTPDLRRCGETWKRPVVEFGESVHFRPVGENNALRGGDQRMLRGVYVGHHERSIWCRDFSHARRCEEGNENCKNDGTREMGSCVRNVVPEAEAEQGVALVIVMPAVPKVDRRRYVTKCTQLASGMHNAKVAHDDRCGDRIGELMAGDDDQRQVE